MKKRSPEKQEVIDIQNLRKKTWLSIEEAAAYIGVSKRTLDAWRYQKNPNGPRYFMGGRVQYNIKDLDRWREERMIDPKVDFAAG